MASPSYDRDERSAPLNPFPRSGPQQSADGWVVFVTGVHEDVQEDDIREAFSEFGTVKNLHLNRDRRTGLTKGYTLIEYTDFAAAQDAINGLHESDLMGKTIRVDWAFVKGGSGGRKHG